MVLFGFALPTAYQNDTTTVPAIKNAFNYFTAALVGKTTYDMTVEYNASTIATLINTNNSYWNTVNGLSAPIKNKFFTNPTIAEIQAFMNRTVVAQQVISLLPANTWYLNAIAAGYDPQNHSQMTSLYSTAVPYYNSLNGASADAKSVLTANYSMNLNAFNAWKEQLFDDIQIYELRALKETIDQKVDELYQYVVPEEEREASFPHLIYGNATEAYTNLQLDVAAGQFAGWLTAINGYKPANVSAVFTEGLGYIQGAQALVNYEIQVRHYESVFASYVEYFTALFNKDLTAIQSEYLMETMYPTVVSEQAAFLVQYDNAVAAIGQEAADKVFGTFNDDISEFQDKIFTELEARITAEVNLAYSYYTAYNQITHQNFTLVKDAIGRVETPIYDFLVSRPYMSQDTRDKYNALFDSILGQYNAFVASAGFNNFTQQTFDGGTGTYYVREAMERDMARNIPYNVTDQKLLDTLNKIDDLLGSPAFAELLDMDGSVEEMLLDLLADELFSDKTVNSLVAMLYPMMVEMFEEDLMGELPSEVDAGIATVPVGYNYNAKSLANALGLKVWPDQLSTLISSSYPQVKSALASAPNWDVLMNEDDEVELNWGVDEAEGYAAKKATFVNALGEALKGVEILFRILLCNYNWSHSISKIAYGEINVLITTIKINIDLDLSAVGNHGYINTVAPILETLGCNPNLIRNASQIQNTTTSAGIVNAIFEPLLDFIENKLAKAPLNTLTEMLPNLAYALTFGRIMLCDNKKALT